MAFLDNIDDTEDAEYDGFEEDLLKEKEEEKEVKDNNINNEIPQDDIIENNPLN